MFDRSLSNWWWQGNHRKRNVCEQKLFENNDNRTWLSLFYNRNDKLQGITVWCKSYANANNARNEIFATSPRVFEAAIVWIRTNFPARNNSLEMLVSPEILRKFAPLENSREHFRGNTQLFKGSYLVTKHMEFRAMVPVSKETAIIATLVFLSSRYFRSYLSPFFAMINWQILPNFL